MWQAKFQTCISNMETFNIYFSVKDSFNIWSSSSSIGTATLVGYGLLNYR